MSMRGRKREGGIFQIIFAFIYEYIGTSKFEQMPSGLKINEEDENKRGTLTSQCQMTHPPASMCYITTFMCYNTFLLINFYNKYHHLLLYYENKFKYLSIYMYIHFNHVSAIHLSPRVETRKTLWWSTEQSLCQRSWPAGKVQIPL